MTEQKELLNEMQECGHVEDFDMADFAILYREKHVDGVTFREEITNVPQDHCRQIALLIGAPVASNPPSPATWQPIETAPKDGSALLGFMPKYFQGKGGQSVIVWLGKDWSDMRAHSCDPSHWMPLPNAPVGQGLKP